MRVNHHRSSAFPEPERGGGRRDGAEDKLQAADGKGDIAKEVNDGDGVGGQS